MSRLLSKISQLVVTIVSILIITAGFATPSMFGGAIARTLKLESGERYALCREYDANLRSFPKLTDTTTEWPLNPSFRNFAKPDWQRVDPAQHIDVIRNIYIFHDDPLERLSDDEEEQYWQTDKEEVMEWINDGEVRLEKAVLDFDAKGKESIAYRYRHPATLFSQKTRTGVPVKAYWYIFYSADTNKPIEVYRRYATWFAFGDSFLFKGRFYLIRPFPRLVIFEPRYVASVDGLAMTPVCQFRLQE